MRWSALLFVALICLTGPARADTACPAGIDAHTRPASPCIDRAGDRVWTPRLAWPESAREPPPAVEAQMRALARLLDAHPEIEELLIEGHQGYDPTRKVWGRCVSCDRARALSKLLIAEGIAPSRLSAQGFAESRPLFDPRDPEQNRLNARFEWHIKRRARAGAMPDRPALKALSRRWRPCMDGVERAPGIAALLDESGRLATIVLDRPGPLDCMAGAIGHRVSDRMGAIHWPAPDRPALNPPPAFEAPDTPGWRCPEGTAEDRRPARACVSAFGTRIWLPPVPRHPKSSVLPPKALPVVDGLVALLTEAPQIARIRIEMHDYRDPHAADRARCHACTRAEVLGRYLAQRGIDPARFHTAGHHAGRPPIGRAAGGPARYEIHVEGWIARERRDTSAPRGQGEEGASTRPRDAEDVERGPTGKSRPTPDASATGVPDAGRR